MPNAKHIDLAGLFPNAKGTTTRTGAEARVKRAKDWAGTEGFLYVVTVREDGTFLPVAILGDRNSYLMHGLMARGFAITNAYV